MLISKGVRPTSPFASIFPSRTFKLASKLALLPFSPLREEMVALILERFCWNLTVLSVKLTVPFITAILSKFQYQPGAAVSAV